MKRPLSIKIAVIFLVVLSLAVSGLALARQFNLLPGAGGLLLTGGPMMGGNLPMLGQGDVSEWNSGGAIGGTPQPGEGATRVRPDGSTVVPGQRGDGSTRPNMPGGMLPGGEMPAMPDGSTPGFQRGARQFTRSLGWLGYAQLVLGLGLGALGLVSAFGVWKLKRWGVVLAILVCAALILTLIPALGVLNLLLRLASSAGWWSLAEYGLRAALGLAVIVLLALPASRRALAAAKPAAPSAAEPDEDDLAEDDAPVKVSYSTNAAYKAAVPPAPASPSAAAADNADGPEEDEA